MLIEEDDEMLLCGLRDGILGGLGDEVDEEDDEQPLDDGELIAISVFADLAAFAIAAFIFADMRLLLLPLLLFVSVSIDG